MHTIYTDGHHHIKRLMNIVTSLNLFKHSWHYNWLGKGIKIKIDTVLAIDNIRY